MPESQPVYLCSNEANLCAGLSTYWLRESLQAGRPYETKFEPNEEVKAMRLHKELPNSSVDRLDRARMETVYPDPVECGAEAIWSKIIRDMLLFPGYSYLTMKGPAVHAMACFVDANHVWFFDPNKGLYRWTKDGAVGAFSDLMKSIYSADRAMNFRVYPIKQLLTGMAGQHQKLPT